MCVCIYIYIYIYIGGAELHRRGEEDRQHLQRGHAPGGIRSFRPFECWQRYRLHLGVSVSTSIRIRARALVADRKCRAARPSS